MVRVAGGPPVGVGRAFTPSTFTNPSTMLLEVEPLVEKAMVLLSVRSLRLLIGESARTYQKRSLVPVKPAASARTGAPCTNTRMAPEVPTPMPMSALPEMIGCSVSPAPWVPRVSSSSPCFLKMPACTPSVGTWFSQLLIWPITTLSLSCASAPAADARAASAAMMSAGNLDGVMLCPPTLASDLSVCFPQDSPGR